MFLTQLAALFLHGIGDYLLQNHWMGKEKTKRWWPCVVHVTIYTACFLVITQNVLTLFIIFSTHLVEDRYYLVRFWIRFKNGWNKKGINPKTGMHKDTPDWLAYWLLYFQDNLLHMIINALALYFIG